MWDLPSFSDDDPKLTKTYLTSRSNLLPNAFKLEIYLNGKLFEKFIFWNTVEAKVIILT